MTRSRLLHVPSPLFSLLALTALVACGGGDKGEEGGVGDDGSNAEGGDGSADSGNADGGEGDDGSEPVAASIELSVDLASANIGDELLFTAVVTDSAGAVMEGEAWTLSADLAEGVNIDGDDAAVLAEGYYTFTATLNSDASITDSVTVMVDDNGPLVLFTAPARGAWLEGAATVVVEGTVTDNLAGHNGEVRINDLGVELSEDGSFSVELPIDPGQPIITAVATDLDGNSADAVMSVINGDFLAPEAVLAESIEVRLHQTALDTLANAMVGELDLASLEDVLISSNPLLDGSFSCVGYEANVSSLDFGGIGASIAPQEGYLDLLLGVTDLDLQFAIVVDACGGGILNYSGSMTAEAIDLVAPVYLSVPEPGDVEVTLGDVEVTFTNFESDFGGLEGLLRAFGLSLSSLGVDPEALIAEQLVSAIEDTVPGALEAALEMVAIDQTFDLIGAEAILAAEISDIEVDPLGLTLILDSEAYGTSTWAELPAHPGSWIQGGDGPDYTGTPGMLFSLSLDLFNRLLHVAWASGALHQELDTGLPAALVQAIFPEAETLYVQLNPALPPVLTAGTGDGVFDLDINEMEVTMTGLVDGEEALLGVMAMHVHAELDAALADGNVISITFNDISTVVDELELDGPSSTGAAEATEEQLSTAAGALLGGLFPPIELAIPELPGFAIEVSSVTPAGPDLNWLSVQGELATP